MSLLPGGYRRTRSGLYRWARVMGNVQPWLELSPRKIIRRWIHRKIGKVFSQQLFGGGGPARLIRTVLGIGRGR